VIALGALVVTAVLTADPCAAAPDNGEGGAPDRDAAALYRAVGAEARAAGDLETARIAFAQAARNDPGSPDAEALREVCRAREAATPPPAAPTAAPAPVLDPFGEGLALLKRGDRVGAIAAFERARAAGEDPPAALLEGICRFELGEAGPARALFEIARRDPHIAPTASFFLGMLALGDGDGERAIALLAEAAAGDPRLAANASTLMVLARRGGRLVLSALSEVGYDSNVELLPDGTATPGAGADGSALVAAGLTGRPFGASGPYARLGGQYRKQFVITSFDLGQAGAAVGAQLARRAADVAAEYGYDFVSLGQAPYLSAHRVLALGRLTLGDTTLAASYAARLEWFLPAATAPYSGLRQDADVRASRRLGPRVTLGLGYRGERDDTRYQPALSYTEHGPRALAEVLLSARARAFLEGDFAWRLYAARDQDLMGTREDWYLDGRAVAELDLGDHWTARLTATARRAFSNVSDLRYTRFSTAVGLAYTFGAL
jgi:tetratricopeptide (TPR) repeat protein